MSTWFALQRGSKISDAASGRALVRRAIHEISEIEAAWLERFADAGLQGDLRGILEAALREAGELNATG